MSKAYVLRHLEKPNGSIPIGIKGEEIWLPNRTQAQMVVDYINETAELEDDVNELNELRDTNKELESDIDDLEDEKDELRETIASLKESMKGIAEDIVEGVSGKEEDYAEDLKLVKDIINQVIEGKR